MINWNSCISSNCLRRTACQKKRRQPSTKCVIDPTLKQRYILLFFLSLFPERTADLSDLTNDLNVTQQQLALVKEAPDLIEICKHEYKLKILFSSNKFLALFANYVKLWKDMSFFISLVLNIFIMGSFNTLQGGDWYSRMTDYNLFNDPSYTQEQTDSLFRVLGIAMIVCSNFVLLFFLFKSVPLILQKVCPSLRFSYPSTFGGLSIGFAFKN